MVANGKVVYFDSNRGFGFLAPEGGGDDVFLHINDISIDEGLLLPGAVVEFDVESTERGSKASNVSVTQEAPAGGDPAAERGFRRDNRDRGDRRERPDRREDRRDDRSSSRPARNAGGPLSGEITELLLDASPDLTARQVTAIRSRILDLATARGWSND
ncbi:cold shock domain-containing protein [Gordonia sp. HY442]|uniref:cold-shock protein n=1 Tax=Gordonia zhenghanii TaxID=2911516 RepID=UPI001F208221|nr:cold shock domain-containing protein [Gordonia zhenghanii]MCF8607535.1 cold shock domain-containing protein [Gordonia zhenghanii]